MNYTASYLETANSRLKPFASLIRVDETGALASPQLMATIGWFCMSRLAEAAPLRPFTEPTKQGVTNIDRNRQNVAVDQRDKARYCPILPSTGTYRTAAVPERA